VQPYSGGSGLGEAATPAEVAAAAAAATAAGTEGAGGHLADAAWREVNLRAAATPAALATLRELACGAVRRLDVTGSRGGAVHVEVSYPIA
jgi:hypothetical protein